ncbi:MAG: DNA methyltransferase [Candidatus Melainabacteria bacterium]|nr:MAG: DNA methyltransferase [Candidatus Melainabacteria bacterium]
MATILEQKAQIDKLWETFWSNGISNPLTVIEQISYLFFIKELDEKHTREERKANRLNRPIENPVFDETPKQQNMRWSKFKDFAPSEMYKVVQEDVFPFIKNMGGENFAKYMKDAVFMIPSPALLATAVDMIDKLEMQDLDTKGDLYEYLLSKIAQAGVNGQFRTPRHIGKMMVELADIQPNDIVCDPSCGTAGFLICAIMYLKEKYPEMFMDTAKLQHFNNDMFYGFDFDYSMLRIASMNMMSHGHQNPNIDYQDSLSEDASNLKEFCTCVIANPPFKGSLNKDTIAKNLASEVSTTKTELLFLALMIRILKTGGRACVIVPDGVLFGTSNAHKTIRQKLIDNQKLEAVISMPSGVFKPYAGVSTAILIFTKTNSGGTDKVWFYDMLHDGFTLNDNRTPIEENDIPDIIASYKNRHNEDNTDRKAKHFFVEADEIRQNGYDLSINKYKEVELEEVQYEAPSKILADIKTLEDEVQQGLKELEGMI